MLERNFTAVLPICKTNVKLKNIARIIGAINEILEKTLTLFPDKLNTLTWTISMILLTC